MFTLINKQYINDVFSRNLLKHQINFFRLHSTPTPFNNFLWRGMAETEEGYYEGYYSWFDENKDIRLTFIPKNHHLISDLKNKKSIKTLKWITNGFYSITEKNGVFYFNDMRYGQINGWHKSDGEFVFSFRIEEPDLNNGNFVSISRERASFNIDKVLLITFFQRIMGKI
jgi:inner membrane protein